MKSRNKLDNRNAMKEKSWMPRVIRTSCKQGHAGGGESRKQNNSIVTDTVR